MKRLKYSQSINTGPHLNAEEPSNSSHSVFVGGFFLLEVLYFKCTVKLPVSIFIKLGHPCPRPLGAMPFIKIYYFRDLFKLASTNFVEICEEIKLKLYFLQFKLKLNFSMPYHLFSSIPDSMQNLFLIIFLFPTGLFASKNTVKKTVYLNGKIIKTYMGQEHAKSSYSNKDVFYLKPRGTIFKKNADLKVSPYEMLDKSCHEKDALSCSWIALFHEDIGEIKKAAKYYSKACQLKDLESCKIGGSHYQFRLKNPQKAFELFKFSCNSGDRLSCFNKGFLMRDLKKPETEAFHSFSKSCQLGLKEAYLEMAYTYTDYYLKNKNISNLKKAEKIFSTYCSSKDLISCQKALKIASDLKNSELVKKHKNELYKYGEKKFCLKNYELKHVKKTVISN